MLIAGSILLHAVKRRGMGPIGTGVIEVYDGKGRVLRSFSVLLTVLNDKEARVGGLDKFQSPMPKSPKSTTEKTKLQRVSRIFRRQQPASCWIHIYYTHFWGDMYFSSYRLHPTCCRVRCLNLVSVQSQYDESRKLNHRLPSSHSILCSYTNTRKKEH